MFEQEARGLRDRIRAAAWLPAATGWFALNTSMRPGFRASTPGVDTDAIMKPQPEPSVQEVLAGLVERVPYHNAENGFCVLRTKARGHRELVTLVGHAATIAATCAS